MKVIKKVRNMHTIENKIGKPFYILAADMWVLLCEVYFVDERCNLIFVDKNQEMHCVTVNLDVEEELDNLCIYYYEWVLK